ncbi:MAG: hypothetical protein R2828_27345 [Saprospiraceae bacterium]
MNRYKPFKPLFLFSILLTSLFFSACQKEKFQDLPPAITSFEIMGVMVNVEDGRLQFSTTLELEQLMDQTKKKTFESSRFYQELGRIKRNTAFMPLEPFLEKEELEQNEVDLIIAKREAELDFYSTFITDERPAISEESFYIHDGYFASILNLDGEVVIEGKVYKYTPIGLFMVDVDQYDALTRLFEDSGSLSTLFNNRSAYAAAQAINEQISYFYPGKEPKNQTLSEGEIETRELDPSNLTYCGGMNSNTLWNSVFGPSADCSDYFDNKRRVKTKIWNQNFFVYSSIGMSVRSQKQTLGAWWPRKISEIEVGYEYVSFLYPGVDYSPNVGIPDPFSIFSLPNGTLVDRWGRTVRENPLNDVFVDWPFRNDDLFSIDIYLGFLDANVIDYDFNPSDFNSNLKSWLRTYVRATLGDLSEEPVNIFDFNRLRTAFTAANESFNDTNENKIQKTFDFNTGQITFGGNIYSLGLGSFGIDFSAEGYDEAEILIWGAGRDGSVQRGNRVRFTDN